MSNVTDSNPETVSTPTAENAVVSSTKSKKSKSTTNKGVTGRVGPGRPKANLKFILNKTFSLADMFTINPTSNKLTVRRHISDAVKAGTFTKLDKKVTTGKRGKPADLFINTKVLNANRANLARTKSKSDNDNNVNSVEAVYTIGTNE